MGTRADFYIGRGQSAEWLGSIAYDGYQSGFGKPFLNTRTVNTWRKRVFKILSERDDGTTPYMGWPWPWEDSNTTDYSYAFDDGRVYCSNFGGKWHLATWTPPDDWDSDEGLSHGERKNDFPNMKSRQKVTLGSRSGIMLISG